MIKAILLSILLCNLSFNLSAMDIEHNTEDKYYLVSLEKDVRIPLDSNDFDKPILLKTFKHNHESIYILQENPKGNVCSGGDLYIIWVRHPSKHNNNLLESISKIENCGGHAPLISFDNNYIKIKIKPWLNTKWNIEGDLISGETWLYKPEWSL